MKFVLPIIKRRYSRVYSRNKKGYISWWGEVSRIEGRRKCEYNICILFTTEGFFQVAIERKVGLSGIWTHNQWILFRCSNWLSYQAISSTRTQSQLCTATPISLFARCHFSLYIYIHVHIILYIWYILYIYMYVNSKNVKMYFS